MSGVRAVVSGGPVTRGDSALRFSRRRLLGLGLATVGLAATGLRPADAQALRFFRIATGTTGGTYFPVGGLIANIVSNPPGGRPCDRGGSCGVPGLIASAFATGGSVDNVQQLRAHNADAALVQADVAYQAFTGTGLFGEVKPQTSLRALASLYVETVHLVVRADGEIRSVADLRGRTVSVGDRGSGSFVNAMAILAAHGLGPADATLLTELPSRSAETLASGAIDAFFMTGGEPLSAIADLATRLPIRLVPLAEDRVVDLIDGSPFFTDVTIPAGIYPGVEETATVGVGALLVCDASVPNDLAHGLVSALWHANSRRVLDSGHPRARTITLAGALRGLSVPLHEGAIRYYREVDLPGLNLASRSGPTTTR